MPALIVLVGQEEDKSSRVRVEEDAEAVVESFASSSSGLAEFRVGKDDLRVWINRENVRMIREAK